MELTSYIGTSNICYNLLLKDAMYTIDLEIDISGNLQLESPLRMALSVHLPDRRPYHALMFAYPGGGLGRHYYDIRIGVDSSYSQAEQLTKRGIVLVACDHLAVGQSAPLPDREKETIELLADANSAVVEIVLDRLGRGDLADNIPRISSLQVIGMGHSMGAGLMVVQQARQAQFDGLVILGWSSRHTTYPARSGGFSDVRFPARGQNPEQNPPERQFSDDEKRFTYYFDDVPDGIITMDLPAVGRPVPPWRSTSRPFCAPTMSSPGVVASEASQIDVPVLVAMGERDVLVDRALELLAYPKATEVTFLIVPLMAHLHNLAGTRSALWDRIATWVECH